MLPLPEPLAQLVWFIYSTVMFPALFYELVVDTLHNLWSFVLTAPLFGAIIWYHWIMVNVWSRVLGKVPPIEDIYYRSRSWLVRYVFINRATLVMALYTIVGSMLGLQYYATYMPVLGMFSAWFWGLIMALMLNIDDLPQIPYIGAAWDTETEVYRIIVGVVLVAALLLPGCHVAGWMIPVLWAEAILSLACGILFVVWRINVAEIGLVPVVTFAIRRLVAAVMMIDTEDYAYIDMV